MATKGKELSELGSIISVTGSTANIDGSLIVSNSVTIGNSTVNATFTATSINANTVGGNTASDLRNYSDTVAGTAYSNAATYAGTVAGTAYSNATAYADNKAANAYSNAIAYSANATNISSGTLTANVLPTSGVTAATYGNSSQIPVITVDTTGRITSATTNAVAGVTSFTYTEANNTFVISTGDGSTFAANIGTANATHTGVLKVLDSVANTNTTISAAVSSVKTAYDAAIAANTNAASAYSNAVSYAGTIAGTAYTNATSYAATIAGTAYSNGVTYTDNKAANAYSNATTFASNATNISSGTLAEPRLPFRMDQNVRTNDSVSFGSVSITGNLTVTGTTVTINTTNLTVDDNMIYLNEGAGGANANPDLGFAGAYNDGTYRHAGFFRDASDGVWKVYDQYLPEPDASPFIDTANASFRIANFQANVVTAASFSGNGASVTSVDAATVGGNTAGTLRSYSDSVAGTAYTNAVSSASSSAATAYSNAISYFTSNYTASDVLTKIKTVDGTGSGLDADTVDGYDASSFALKTDPEFTNDITTSSGQGRFGGWYAGTGYTGAAFEVGISGGEAQALAYNRDTNSYLNMNFAATDFEFAGQSSGYAHINTSFRAPIFYDSNDTGYYTDPNSTSNIRYLKVNTTGTSSGTRALTIKSDGQAEINFGSYTGAWTSALQIQNNDNTDFVWISPLQDGTSARFRTGGSGLDFYTDGGNDAGTYSAFIGSGSVRAPIFYDLDNTSFYVDPASTSNLSALNVGGSAVWTSGNDGAGSGLDADLLDGLNQTTAATASTIVARDSNGHITGNYILGSYFNSSAGNSENPTIGQIWTQSTGDNYLRKSTPAHFISQLGLATTSNLASYLPLSGGTMTGNLGLGSSWLLYDDTNRNASAATYNPNSQTRAVRFSFADASGTGTGGNFAGVMHFHPWDGTTASTGDASYQLAFGSSATNGGGVPILGLRKGIDTTWNSWYYLAAYGVNYKTGALYATQLIDSDSTGYYVDPASTSNINVLSAAGGIQAPYIGINNATSTNGFGLSLYGGYTGGEPTYGIMFQGTGTFGTYGSVYADWATYLTMNSTPGRGWIFRNNSTGNVAGISNAGQMTLASHLELGNNFGMPNIEWSASSTSTGMVIFYLPGTTSNYGMVHMVFDIYEYDSPRVATVIIGGHNWSTSWYNNGCNVIGYTEKQVRLGVKDGRFCVIFGTSGSSWSYGTIRLRKIHNGSFYNDNMNMTGDWSVVQTTTESFTNVTGDLRGLRTPANFEVDNIGYAYGSFRAPIFYDTANTSYYTDPASTSRMNAISLDQVNVGDGTFLFTTGANSGTTRHLNLSTYGGDPSQAQTGQSGITWGYRTDSSPYYMIYLTHGDYSAHTKLTLSWHTGIRIGASSSYGGTAFYQDALFLNPALLFTIGRGDDNVRSITNFHAPIMYDYNNTGYYCDPNSTSYLYHLVLSGASYFRPQNWIQMDSSYGMYWPNTNGAHLEGNTLSSYGSIAIRGSRNGWRGIHFYDGGSTPHLMFDGSSNGGIYYESGGRWAQYYHYGNVCQSINTASSSSSYGLYVSGAIYSTSNITAYSDARKKENVVTVDNALEKVNNLRGVYYNRIDDEKKTKQIGVIAQEINEVVPEVVTYAEDVDEYGVTYGNLAGLFIEAFKEQTKVINDLKQKIEELESKLNK